MGRIITFLRNINYLSKHSLWEQREEDIVYLTEKILSDGFYEYGIENPIQRTPRIMTKDESLDFIFETEKSFVRTGDGECKIMMGMDQPFQRYEKEIDIQLRKLLSAKCEKIAVGINRNYFVPLGENQEYYRRNAYDYRKVYFDVIDENATYLDATFTSSPNFDSNQQAEEDNAFYEKWTSLFEEKDVVIVCGDGILDKLKHDVFYKAKSKRYIYGPRIDAWDKHDELINEILKTVPTSAKIVFILGMAGKAMIPELVEAGYTCWDVGHLAKYYDAYMSKTEWTREFRDKFYAPD